MHYRVSRPLWTGRTRRRFVILWAALFTVLPELPDRRDQDRRCARAPETGTQRAVRWRWVECNSADGPRQVRGRYGILAVSLMQRLPSSWSGAGALSGLIHSFGYHE